MNPNSNDLSTSQTGINNGANELQVIDNSSLDKSNQDNKPPDAQNPTHCTGFTTVPPNEARWSKLQRTAQKGLEDYNRWKDEHRPGPIHLAPEKLGGSASLAEVRQRQQVEASRSKLQKKLKKEEMDKRSRQEKEEKYQTMKAIQREKANKLNMQEKEEEERRKELYQLDFQRRREEYLQSLERSTSVPTAASNSTPTSSWARGREHSKERKTEEQETIQRKNEEQRRKGEILEEKQKQQERERERQMESERLRVNSAFLDRLEARGSGGVSESPPRPLEGGNIWQADEPEDPASSHGPFQSQVHSDSAQEVEEEACGGQNEVAAFDLVVCGGLNGMAAFVVWTGRRVAVDMRASASVSPDADSDWAVMMLQNHFPFYGRDLLEDIVSQCNGNYQQAYDLLNV